MIKTLHYVDPLPDPIKALEEGFRVGGLLLVQYAFRYSYFLDPDRVREIPVKFPDFARYSRTHYPGKRKGEGVGAYFTVTCQIWGGVEQGQAPKSR